jgi:hypothetical protein
MSPATWYALAALVFSPVLHCLNFGMMMMIVGHQILALADYYQYHVVVTNGQKSLSLPSWLAVREAAVNERRENVKTCKKTCS